VFPGAAETCDFEDDDCDGAVDEGFDADADGVASCGDCAPEDGGAYAVPGAVAGVAFLDEITLAWNPSAPSAGAGTVHDVVRGLVGELPVGAGAAEICMAPGILMASTTDGAEPFPGSAHWYLVRGRNTCGAGGYGAASDGSERLTAACP
jgi:hypothetical protein